MTENKAIEWRRKKLSNADPIKNLFQVSLSQLNTFLLELVRSKVKSITPSSVLEQYESNRFFRPSEIDPIELRKTELKCLQIAMSHSFVPINLSPLAPLGSSSILGPVDQNNVISALRGTEVISDATNILVIQLASEFKQHPDRNKILKNATVHRHVRGQSFDNPKFSAHFSTFCMASAGYDSGNFQFELEQLQEHLVVVYSCLSDYFSEEQLSLRFYLKKNASMLMEKIDSATNMLWSERSIEWVEDEHQTYYQLLQFKVFVKSNGQIYDIADGGFVDWTQQLLQNKKHRCMISGIGIELLHRLQFTPGS